MSGTRRRTRARSATATRPRPALNPSSSTCSAGRSNWRSTRPIRCGSPWTVSKYDTDGHISFVPNNKYSGKDKPTYKTFEQIPFATDSAEFNSLLAGDVDYGYLPLSDLKQRSRVSSQGYHFSAWNLWTVHLITINY